MGVVSKIKLFVKASNTKVNSLELERKIELKEVPSTLQSEVYLDHMLDVIIDLLKEARDKVLEEYTIVYEFRYEFIDENDKLIEDNSFATYFDAIVNEAINFPDLHNKLLSFVNQSYYKENDSRFWRDSETPVGSSIASSLALYDKKYIVQYIDFLRTNDMDHEVDQRGDISEIIDKYGICKETLTLAIARASSACGQWGEEQFQEFLEDDFLDYIASNFDLFLKKLAEEHQYEELMFLDLDYEEFWKPGDMETSWIETLLEVLDDPKTEKFRLFCKERL